MAFLHSSRDEILPSVHYVFLFICDTPRCFTLLLPCGTPIVLGTVSVELDYTTNANDDALNSTMRPSGPDLSSSR